MQTEAVFENIAERIQSEIKRAKKSIFIAIAWFTNKNIFNELLLKSELPQVACKLIGEPSARLLHDHIINKTNPNYLYIFQLGSLTIVNVRFDLINSNSSILYIYQLIQ